MSIAVLFLATGLLLIVLLLRLFSRDRTGDRVSIELLDNTEEVGSFYPRLPRRELTHRLFGSDDWVFVLSQKSDRTKRIFLQERKSLALAWMKAVRRSTKELMNHHRMMSRTSSELETFVELEVVANYFLFQILWQFVVLAIWLHGPTGLSGLISRVDASCERFSAAIKELLPAELDAEAKAAAFHISK
jgi:hypothetical protein